MQGLITSSVGHSQSHRGDILMRIALRRERFVWLITQLTGVSAARAEEVFRPLPFIDSRRGSKMAVAS